MTSPQIWPWCRRLQDNRAGFLSGSWTGRSQRGHRKDRLGPECSCWLRLCEPRPVYTGLKGGRGDSTLHHVSCYGQRVKGIDWKVVRECSYTLSMKNISATLLKRKDSFINNTDQKLKTKILHSWTHQQRAQSACVCVRVMIPPLYSSVCRKASPLVTP